MSITFKRVGFLLPAVLGLASGCGGSNLVLPSEGVAAKIVVVSGDKQAGVVGVPLVANIVVRVTDSKDGPVQSQQVTFTPADANSGQTVPPSATTNADGQASVQWVLGAVAGTQTMLAKAVGNGAPANLSVSFTATASSSVPAKLEKVAGTDGQTATAGTAVAPAPAVKVTDAQGNPVAGVGVKFAVATGGGSVNPTTAVATNANGVAAVTSWTLGTTAGSNTLTATIPGTGVAGNPATFTATGVPGSAGALGIAQQPSATAQSGVAFAQQPKIQLQDAGGNAVHTAGIAVTAAIASGTGGTLGGQLTVSTDNQGIATFTNLAITGLQGTYTISFTNPTLTGITSAPIVLAPGAPAQLAITTQPPVTAQSGVTLSPQPVVQVQDAQGNPVAQAGIAVTASLNGTGGSLSGTKTISTDATGSAAFTNLAITGSSGTYTITFSALQLTPATSNGITLGAGTPTQLAFVQQPSNAVAGAVITPAVTVSIEDGSGNVVTNASNQVTVAVANNPGGGTLSGTLTVAAVNGVATFSGLSINKAGTGYTLSASSTGLTGATSAAFTVTAAAASQLVFTQQPSNVVAGSSIAPAVQLTVEDQFGNTVTTAAMTITIAIGTNAGGGTLSGTTAKSPTGGTASFSNLSINVAGDGYTLTANGAGLPQATSSSFKVSAGPAATMAAHSSTTQNNIVVGSVVPAAPSVLITDALGNPVAGVTVTFTVTQGGGTISPTSPVSTNASGIATLTSWTVGTVPGANEVQAAAFGLSAVVFTANTVAGPPASITINTQPGFNLVPVSGQPFDTQPVVTAKDSFGNPVPGVQVTASLIGSGTLGGSNNPVTTDGNGVATFTDLSITGSGSFQVVFTADSATATSNTLVYP